MAAGAVLGGGGRLPSVGLRLPEMPGSARGLPTGQPRTQSSIAVSADHRSWFLLNASPDLRAQFEASRALPDQAIVAEVAGGANNGSRSTDVLVPRPRGIGQP